MKKKIVAVALFVGMGLALNCTTPTPSMAASSGATTTVAGQVEAGKFERDGFVTRVDKRGHLWVFTPGSKSLADFDDKGAPAVHTVRPLAGPGQITMKEVEAGTIDAYLLAKPGFVTRMDRRGHLWVFKVGSKALADYESKGAPAVHTVRPLAGSDRITMKEVEAGTIDDYLKAPVYR